MKLDKSWILGFIFFATVSVTLGNVILSPRDCSSPKYELAVYDQKMSKALEDVGKKSTELSMEVQTDWEQLLLPMPSTVALLGQLMVLSTAKDFNLQANPDKPFQFLKYPSFRATLVQVTNECWEAFNQAHKNMGSIRMAMSTVPGLLRQSVNYIVNGSPTIIQKYLPIPINSLEKVTKDSSDKAVETEKAFNHVMHLLAEVLEVTTDTDSQKSIKLEEIKIQLQLAEIEKKLLEEREAFMKEEFQKVSDRLDEDRAAFEKAMRDIPTGWTAVLQDLTVNVGSLVSKGMMGTIMGVYNNDKDARSAATRVIYDDKIILQIAGNVFTNMKSFIDKIDNWTRIVEEEKITVDVQEQLIVMNAGLSSYKSVISSKTSSKWFNEFNTVLDKGLTMMNDALDASKSLKEITVEVLNSIKSNINELIEETQPMLKANSELDNSLESGQLGANEDGWSKMCQSSKATNNGKCVAQMRENRLKNTEARYDEMFKKISEENKEMTKFLMEISRMDMSKIEITEILELLKKGIQKLSEIRAQWGALIRFFDTLRLHAKSLTEQKVKNFILMANMLEKDELPFMKNDLRIQTEQIFVSAKYVHVLSDSYMDVSENHLMRRLAMLPSLVTLRDEAEKTKVLTELTEGCQAVQDKIFENAKIRKANFDNELQAQMKEIHAILKNIDDSFLLE